VKKLYQSLWRVNRSAGYTAFCVTVAASRN
jgi:hypothetical protein